MSAHLPAIHSRPDPARRAWGLFAIGILIGVAGLAFFARQGVRDYRVFHLYLPTQCTIVREDILKSTMNAGSGRTRSARTTYFTEFTFQHRVNGELYTAVGSDNMGGIMGDVGGFDVGRVYPCWYDPADPQEAVLERNFRPLFYLVALLPLAFLLIGGNFLWLALGPKPTMRIAQGGRGDVLPVRLAPELSGAATIGVAVGVLVVWTAGLLAACAWIVLDWSRLEDFGFFLLLAVGAEVGLIRFAAGAASSIKIPDPIVEIDHEPLAPGDKMRVSIRQAGPARFDLFRVSLVCERQDRGNTKKHQKAILVKKGFQLDPTTSFTDLVETAIDRDAAPSDATLQSFTTWRIVVKRAKKGVRGLDREYAFRVVDGPQDHHGRTSKASTTT